MRHKLAAIKAQINQDEDEILALTSKKRDLDQNITDYIRQLEPQNVRLNQLDDKLQNMKHLIDQKTAQEEQLTQAQTHLEEEIKHKSNTNHLLSQKNQELTEALAHLETQMQEANQKYEQNRKQYSIVLEQIVLEEEQLELIEKEADRSKLELEMARSNYENLKVQKEYYEQEN